MIPHLLRIELRRNTVLLLLPVLAALAVLSPAWRHLSALALWPARSLDVETALQGVAPVFAGAAAWVAGRERRCAMEDLLTTTPHSPWTRLLIMWAATTLWGVLVYLLIVAVLLSVTAQQAAWGAPVPWPLLVGLLAILACAALGFALGHHLPGRFTPPLVGVAVFVTLGLGITLVNHGDRIGYLVSMTYPSVTAGDSLWYVDRPDLGLVQSLYLLGLTALGLGSLGIHVREGVIRRAARLLTPLLAAVGLVLAGMSVALIVSSRVDNEVVRVPLFGGPPTMTLLSYRSVCDAAAFTVCVHPAYRPELAETFALLNRLAAPVRGLPGAPTRATQQPITVAHVVREGAQRVLFVPPIDFHDPTNPPHLVEGWVGQAAVSLVDDRLAANGRAYWTTDKAQNAVALYLLHQSGERYDPAQFDQGLDVRAAEQRFAALPVRVRRAWLDTHYDLLRQGAVRLEDLP